MPSWDVASRMLEKLDSDKTHVCIRIFKDDTVIITDPDGKPLTPSDKPQPLVGPHNTYAQAVWYNRNPT